MSGDSSAVQAKFRASIGAPFSFVADRDARLISLYDTKVPILKRSRRVTYVIGQAGTIDHLEQGAEAVDPSGAVGACSLR